MLVTYHLNLSVLPSDKVMYMNKSLIVFSIQQIQCDKCDRWFHNLCLNMDQNKLKEVKKRQWLCVFLPMTWLRKILPRPSARFCLEMWLKKTKKIKRCVYIRKCGKHEWGGETWNFHFIYSLWLQPYTLSYWIPSTYFNPRLYRNDWRSMPDYQKILLSV